MKTIIATYCNPYNARTHYHGEEVLKYDGITPVKWVFGEYDNEEEAKDALANLAYSYATEHDSLSYEDYASVEDSINCMIEDGATPEEVKEAFSWFKGTGIYCDHVLEYAMGDTSFSFDVLTFMIEER